jgi:hypothetical protein
VAKRKTTTATNLRKRTAVPIPQPVVRSAALKASLKSHRPIYDHDVAVLAILTDYKKRLDAISKLLNAGETGEALEQVEAFRKQNTYMRGQFNQRVTQWAGFHKQVEAKR